MLAGNSNHGEPRSGVGGGYYLSDYMSHPRDHAGESSSYLTDTTSVSNNVHPLPKLMAQFPGQHREPGIAHAAQRRQLPYSLGPLGPNLLEQSHSYSLDTQYTTSYEHRKGHQDKYDKLCHQHQHHLHVKHESNESSNDNNDNDSLSPARHELIVADDCFSWQDLSDEQLVCICDTLLQSQNTEKLAKFLSAFPENSAATQKEMIVRAQAHLYFAQKNYKKLYEIMESKKFSINYHSEMQKMWLEGETN